MEDEEDFNMRTSLRLGSVGDATTLLCCEVMHVVE